MTFASQRTLLGFLVMAYDRLVEVDKFLFESFSSGRPRFYAISYLKLEAKEIFL